MLVETWGAAQARDPAHFAPLKHIWRLEAGNVHRTLFQLSKKIIIGIKIKQTKKAEVIDTRKRFGLLFFNDMFIKNVYFFNYIFTWMQQKVFSKVF